MTPITERVLFVHPKKLFMTVEESYTDILGVKHREKKTVYLNPAESSDEPVPALNRIEALCELGFSRREIAQKLNLSYLYVSKVIKKNGIPCRNARNTKTSDVAVRELKFIEGLE